MATVLWSRHPILRSDETWLPEWSGNLGRVKRCAVRSRIWSEFVNQIARLQFEIICGATPFFGMGIVDAEEVKL
jgi:hypothetical protein